MTHDDAPAGRLLSRRTVLELMGATGAAWLAGGLLAPRGAFAAPTACVARPEQSEGPFFVDNRLNRSDIRSDPGDGRIKPGAPLALTLLVARLAGGKCEPLAGAHVDLWQCDAQGFYSDVRDWRRSTAGQAFLRGYQLSDARGEARFVTVYPGAYPGRAVHVHFKIRTDPAARRGLEFTSQLYFPDALSDRVLAAAPYPAREQRRTRNEDDFLYRRGGDQLLLEPVASAGGYAASFAVGLQV